MHRHNLKVRNFQASAVSFLCVLLVHLLTGAVNTGAAPDTSGSEPDTVEAFSDSLSGETTGSTVADSAGNDSTREDDEYIFSEEYDAVSNVETEENPEDTTVRTVAVSAEKTSVSKRSKRFLAVITFIRQQVRSNARLFSGPVSLVRKHAAKLLVLGISLVIILLTISFYRERLEKGRFMTTTRLSVMDKEVQRACRYIEEHFDDPELGTDRICTALVTGTAFLEALFVKELGLTVEDFIAQVRINRAKITLRHDSSIDLSVVSTSTGFTDEQVFSERFTAITGSTPDEYRSNLAESSDAAS